MGKTYDFNTADTLNTLLLNCIFASGQLKGSEMYDVDFDHQFIETEKYDASADEIKKLRKKLKNSLGGCCYDKANK